MQNRKAYRIFSKLFIWSAGVLAVIVGTMVAGVLVYLFYGVGAKVMTLGLGYFLAYVVVAAALITLGVSLAGLTIFEDQT